MNQRPVFLFNRMLLVCLLACFIQSQAQQPNWSATGSLDVARTRHTATLLANGKVLVVGGLNGTTPLGSAELYDPATGRWSATGSLITPRYDHAAVRLANGKALVVGGSGGPIFPTSAEIYDPETGVWSDAGNPGVFFPLPKATLLADSRALVTGGFIAGGRINAVVVYDPAINAWSSAGAMNAERLFHSTTLLPDGRVLVAGGLGPQFLRTAEVYDPATNRWTLTGELTAPRGEHQVTLLANGKVLVAGGVGESPNTFISAELYDPATSKWSATRAPTTYRVWHTLTLLPNGKALAAGGLSFISAELYDPATGSWTLTAALRQERQRHTATLLPNGKVLVVGGETLSTPTLPGSTLASAELFDSGEPNIASASAASFAVGPLAPEAIVAAFGTNLATSAQTAAGLPLPTQLAGVNVRVRDSAGAERDASLFFVSPNQINYQIPPGVVNGPATVTVSSGATGIVEIASIAPGLFSANGNGQGVAAAVALRIKANGAQSFEPVAQFDAAQNRFVAAPIDVSDPTEQVFLLLFGTGIRNRSSLANVRASIGAVGTEVLFAGAQSGFVGLDQCNLRLPSTLTGRGEVDVILTVDGKAANAVKVRIK